MDSGKATLLYISWYCRYFVFSILYILQQYADDTQLYITLSATDPSAKTELDLCMSFFCIWLCFRDLAFNPYKSEAILLTAYAVFSSHSFVNLQEPKSC